LEKRFFAFLTPMILSSLSAKEGFEKGTVVANLDTLLAIFRKLL
jgi:hypothetical protein